MKFIEYARRRKQGFGIKDSLDLAGNSTSGDTAVGLVIAGVLVLFLAYSTAQYLDDMVDAKDLRVMHVKQSTGA